MIMQMLLKKKTVDDHVKTLLDTGKKLADHYVVKELESQAFTARALASGEEAARAKRISDRFEELVK